jgi:hypothetical protein
VPDLIRVVRRYGAYTLISSNMNRLLDPVGILEADPSEFVLSISGFNQEFYGITHRGGDIEQVKANMRLLAEARTKTGAATKILVSYHVYAHNLRDAIEMKALCEELGFVFYPTWAVFMPIEKVMAYGQDPMDPLITDEDRRIIDRLAVPLDEALARSRQYRTAPCHLLEQQITLDHAGQVALCCGSFAPENLELASFLEVPLSQIQVQRTQHPTCARCLDSGAHVYAGQQGRQDFTEIGINAILGRDILALKTIFGVNLVLGGA